MKTKKIVTTFAVALVVLFTGCQKDQIAPLDPFDLSGSLTTNLKSAEITSVPLGSASYFAVIAGTTVTNDGPSLITGNLGVSPGTAITGFQPIPFNTIEGPGTVTTGLGTVIGTIYAGGTIAAQAQVDASIAYNYLIAQEPDIIFDGVTQLDGLTFTPGVYRFAPSANLQVNGTVYLDFQGNSDALFIFQLGTTLVTMDGSNVIALNHNSTDCMGANVYWAVGSSATINGAQFVGSVVATTTITMTSGKVSGRMLALNGGVSMITDTISICTSNNDTINPPIPVPHVDFVTGGGWIEGNSNQKHGKKHKNDKITFAVNGGIKHGEFWGQLECKDHGIHNMNIKGTGVTAYLIIDEVTRQIEGTNKINGQGSYTYKVIVVDNGEPGRNDSFSIEVSNGYKASGILKGGNIKIHDKGGNK